MNTLLALLTVLFQIADPASDAIGDGTLQPPTAAIYASNAVFDVRNLSLRSTADGELTVVLEMAALERDEAYENGFQSLIADVYIDTEPDGENALLTPGEWLLEPAETWNYLVRITPDGTYGLTPGDELTDAVSLTTELHETQIVITLPRSLRIAEEYEPYAYALTGLYDPFAADLWRAVSATPSPWSFSSDAALPTPVLDITAPDIDVQESAFQNRVMPKEHVTVSRSLVWVVVMFAGLLIAIAGWVLRLQKRPAVTAVTADPVAEPTVAPDSAGADASVAKPARKLELLAPVKPVEQLISESAKREVDDVDDEEIVIPFVERRG